MIAAFISRYRNIREYARKETTNFVEVYVNCSVETCAQRDPKGLYKKASAGQIKDLTGPQDLYEEPLNLSSKSTSSKPRRKAGRLIAEQTRSPKRTGTQAFL